MEQVIFSKFNKYIFFPDLGNKFLYSNNHNIIRYLKNHIVYFEYIFGNYNTFSPIVIKLALVLESVYPKRCSLNTQLIKSKYSKNTIHSRIYLSLTLYEVSLFYQYYTKKPADILKISCYYLKEKKFYSFPGYISMLKFPSWERYLNFNLNVNKKNLNYSFYICKSALLD